ncbi:MAG: hypothetical protein F4X77_02320 [Acidobacteriia bacterium]|nr:hypothetical protein [Terriglobia bacterium]
MPPWGSTGRRASKRPPPGGCTTTSRSFLLPGCSPTGWSASCSLEGSQDPVGRACATGRSTEQIARGRIPPTSIAIGMLGMRKISLTIANQGPSELVKEVEEGESFVITRGGCPIAKLAPHRADEMANLEWASA